MKQKLSPTVVVIVIVVVLAIVGLVGWKMLSGNHGDKVPGADEQQMDPAMQQQMMESMQQQGPGGKGPGKSPGR